MLLRSAETDFTVCEPKVSGVGGSFLALHGGDPPRGAPVSSTAFLQVRAQQDRVQRLSVTCRNKKVNKHASAPSQAGRNPTSRVLRAAQASGLSRSAGFTQGSSPASTASR